MGSVTNVVRSALVVLGFEAADREVKAYIKKNYTDVPQSQISLALRKIRFPQPRVRTTTRTRFNDDQPDLFES
ncbi:MAG: hypothetical protein JFAIHJKO_01059 [Pyrinomonadaceae bacterium]|nr:hypothetical protein [Pyrinomonadaceae bacterium]